MLFLTCLINISLLKLHPLSSSSFASALNTLVLAQFGFVLLPYVSE